MRTTVLLIHSGLSSILMRYFVVKHQLAKVHVLRSMTLTKVIYDKVYICIKFVSLYVLYEIMWNTCVTLIYSFIMYILICTSRNLLQCCTSNSNVV